MATSRPLPPPPTERHKRAVAAVEALFRLYPLEAARWLSSQAHDAAKPLRVLEATFLEQPSKGPAYVVPPPRHEAERPVTVEGLLQRGVTDALAREAAKAGDDVRVVSFDLNEMVRQTLAK